MAPIGVSCHHHSHQTDCTSRFSLHIAVRLATKPKMPIFRPKNNIKNYTYLSLTFNPNICSKMKSLPNTANLNVGTCRYLTGSFPLNVFPWLYFSHFIRPSVGCLKSVSLTPVKNSGKSSHTASTELPHFPFHRFFISVEPPSTTSKIPNSMNFLLLQTRPNCLGRSCNPSTKRPERQLHSWASMFATQHVWRLTSPLFSFRGLSLPTAQLDDARLGVSAEENGSKTHL